MASFLNIWLLFVQRKYLTGASTIMSLVWKTISFVITTFGLWPAVQTLDFIIVISEASTPYFRLRIIMFSVFFTSNHVKLLNLCWPTKSYWIYFLVNCYKAQNYFSTKNLACRSNYNLSCARIRIYDTYLF